MVQESLKKKALILFKRLSRDINSGKHISPSKCNDYIDDLESLQEKLYDSGCNWIEDYPEIDHVEEPGMFSDGADDDQIGESLEEVKDQLDRMLGELGIDATESNSHSPTSNVAPVTIINSPTISQHAEITANTNIQLEISRLEEEFNKEAEKIIPNKTKLQNIIDKLKKLGPIALPVVQRLTERLADMFLF